MELNGINSSYVASTTYQSTKPVPTTEKSTSPEEASVVYEKSDSSEAIDSYSGSSTKKVDQATIDKLKADAEQRYSQLKSLVEKLMTKQSQTSTYATMGDFMQAIADGQIEVDPEVIKQAKKDVADDGYWGVDQTAERIVSFAKALSGGDETKIESMRKAIEDGYSAATKSWGKDLPEISQKTRDKVNELLDKWASGEEEA